MIVPAANRLDEISEYYFSRKLEQIRKMTEAGADVINLGIGSPDLTPSQATIQAATKGLESEKAHGYAPYRSSPELRRAIAKWYDETYQVKLDPEREVLPLLGSKEGLFYLAMAFLNPGDQALVPNPGYPAYASVTRLAGGVPLTYGLDEHNGWWPDFVAIEKQDLSRVKLMWVNYPHMPTGAQGGATLFVKLVEFGRKHGILICHDNPYGLVLNETPPASVLKHDPGLSNTIELNSFSKAFNMAGWRVGMLLGHREIIDTVLKVKSNVDSGMFTPVQLGAIAALENPPEWHAERNRVYRERRAEAYRIFDQLGFTYTHDQVGLFIWARAPEEVPDVEKFLDDVLAQARVFLTPGFIFGSNGQRYARCSLCSPVERLKEARIRLEAMK